MSQLKVRKALTEALLGTPLGVTLNFPNLPAKTAPGSLSGDVTFVFNEPDVFTLGDKGEDILRGFVQVLLKVPAGTGDGVILAEGDTLRQVFSAGSRKFNDGQEVVIERCGLGAFDILDGRLVCPVTIYFYSLIRR